MLLREGECKIMGATIIVPNAEIFAWDVVIIIHLN